MGKTTPGLIYIIKNLLQAYIKRLSDLTYLASLEARLASKTLVTLIFLAVLMLFLLSSTWLSLLFLIFFILDSYHFSSIFSSGIIVGLNLIMLLVLYLYMQKIKKNLSFSATRRQIAKISRSHKD